MELMQALDELNRIDSSLRELEGLIVDENLVQAEKLLKELSDKIRILFNSISIENSAEAQQSALLIYNTLSLLIEKVLAEKQKVAKSLSGHISNKKKINAYKSI
jgi:hypothetical protein